MAWISGSEDIDFAEVFGEGFDVIVDGDFGPVLSEDLLAELLWLTEGDCGNISICSASSVCEGEGESSDSTA